MVTATPPNALSVEAKTLPAASEQLFDACIELCGRRKQAIVAPARVSCDPVGNFLLHHDHHGVEVLAKTEQSQQNVGGYVIRKIADHLHWFGLIRCPGAQSRLRAEHRVEVDGQHVGFDDLNIPRSCPNFIRSCAASTRSSSIAISRRARFGKHGRKRRLGPGRFRAPCSAKCRREFR